MSGWRGAVEDLSLDRHRELEDVRGVARRGVAVPFEESGHTFKDDAERWVWEKEQHTHYKNSSGFWLDASGQYVLGLPVYPGAVVIERNSHLNANKEARALGFCMGYEMWTVAFERLKAWRMHLRAVQKLATIHPHLVRCVVRAPHLEHEGVLRHTAFFKMDELVEAYLASPIAVDVRLEHRRAVKRARAKIPHRQRAQALRSYRVRYLRKRAKRRENKESRG